MTNGPGQKQPGSRAASLLLVLATLACAVIGSHTAGQGVEPGKGAIILNDLRNFRQMGSVLYIAAHPDDENTQLIAFLARGRNYRTGYLSLTRGDGGQNLLGPEFGSELGLIRTQELLAARRIDGGVQFFSRARDFGFSKDYQQTLTRWDRAAVVADIVRVIREFRPDVIITRFSPQPSHTHGHHTASAVLALEAFKLAGDPARFPELKPWQPRRIVVNVGGPVNAPTGADLIHLEIGGTDPVTGKSFGDLAAQSRSMHKTQGFGNYTNASTGSRLEAFQLLDGEPASKDILDGVDTSWSRVPGGAEIGALADRAIAGFNAADPSASLPTLLQIRARVMSLAPDPLVEEKRRLLDRIVAECIGLEVETTVPSAEIVPGEALKMHHVATVHSTTPVRWMGVRTPGLAPAVHAPIELHPNHEATRDETVTLPSQTPVSQPYWLRADGTAGMFRVDDVSLIGRPENPPVVTVENVFEVGGQTLIVPGEPVHAGRRLDVIPPVSIGFGSEVQLFHPSATRTVQVNLTASRPNVAGTLQLDAPSGWTVASPSRPFRLAAVGSSARFAFTLTAPPQAESANLMARTRVGRETYDTQRVLIRYDHIPPQLIQSPARMKVVCLNLAIAGRRVGYLPGAGDSIPAGLEQMGYEVETLAGSDLTATRLQGLDAIVVGVRAFNVRTDLAANLPALFAFVQAGGTVVEQYNTPKGLQSTQLAPFNLSLSDNLPQYRVTDENAPVTWLAPQHPAFNVPNKIVPADFDGWIQERGLDFAAQWDTDHFTALLACNDTGEEPLRGGLLVARYGKGYFVYTGLSFFRQLPAGVPARTGCLPIWFPLESENTPVESDAEAETTGLPRLRTWRAVYLGVIAVFLVWDVLLTVLSTVYR